MQKKNAKKKACDGTTLTTGRRRRRGRGSRRRASEGRAAVPRGCLSSVGGAADYSYSLVTLKGSTEVNAWFHFYFFYSYFFYFFYFFSLLSFDLFWSGENQPIKQTS